MNTGIATLFARLLLGLIFFWQGFGKVFTIGVATLYENGFKSYEDTFLPTFVVKSTAYFTSYGELIFGFLLILGLFRKQSYYALGLILLIVSFGHGLQTPIWDLQHVFVRSAFLIFLLMTLNKDSFALDVYFKKQSKSVTFN